MGIIKSAENFTPHKIRNQIMTNIKILAVILALCSISTADGLRCYQCTLGDSIDFCWMSSNGNGHVVDCESDQNGCMIVYFEDAGMPRHSADCSIVPEETPEEERFCKYDPEYPD